MKNKPSIPKSAAACADLLYTTRNQRLALNREVEKLEELESALKDFFINSLSKDSTGIAGRIARVQVTPKVIPIVEDWPGFYKYVKRTGSFDLLQKRLATQAIEDRWESGTKIPGVGRLQAKTVSCTVLKHTKKEKQHGK